MEDYRASPPRAGAARNRRRCSAEIEALRDSPFVEYERVSALKLRFLKLRVRAVSARVARRVARGARISKPSRDAKATCSRRSPLIARSTSTCTAAIPISGCGPTGRRAYQRSRLAETARVPPETLAARHVLPVPAVADRPAAAPRRSSARATGICPSACITTWRWPPTVSARDLWAHRPFFVAGCRVGSPPDDFSPKGQDWAFPPPNSRAAPRGRLPPVRRIDPQELPARRRAAHRSRDAALPPLLDSRRRATPPKAPTCASASQDFVRILALESVRNQVVVVGEDLGTVEPVDPRDAGALRHPELPAVLFREERARRIPPHRRISGAGAGLVHHARSADAGRILDRRRHRGAPRAPASSTTKAMRAQLEQRATEKQKMLDVLFAAGAGARRPAALAPAISGTDGRTAQRHRRISGDDAVAVAGHQSGGPDQGDRTSRICPAARGSIRTGAARCASRSSSCAAMRRLADIPPCSTIGSSAPAGAISGVARAATVRELGKNPMLTARREGRQGEPVFCWRAWRPCVRH